MKGVFLWLVFFILLKFLWLIEMICVLSLSVFVIVGSEVKGCSMCFIILWVNGSLFVGGVF